MTVSPGKTVLPAKGKAKESLADKPITALEVRQAQDLWASSIKSISKEYLNGGDYVGAAGKAAGVLYGYGHTDVLFKPTKAEDVRFRPEASQAMSYFVGCDAVDEGIPEDGGFAINGGKGWADVVFDNKQVDLNGNTAIAMGTYDFTCATTGDKSTVEYTFGYRRNDDGQVRIFLHHSSLPYGTLSKPPAAVKAVSESEVKDAQAAWAAAIADISKVMKDGGDYVATAGAAAGELYGYGHGNVLFKPTKALDMRFRPEASQAMSYFVGADAVVDGIPEDGGFAINGGKGWASVVFDNHQVEVNGNVAIAMGTYDFTCATTGDVSTVEYTFGYKRCADDKVRIFLHHSSVPYPKPAAPVEEEAKEKVGMFGSK